MRKTRGLWVGAFLLAWACGAAFGDTSFRWLVDQNSLRDQLNNPIAAGNATVLSFASSNGAIDLPAHPMSTPFASTYGDDYFYAAMPNLEYFGQPGSYTTDYMAKTGNDFVGMYVYAIVLNLPYASFTGLATIPVGTFYGVTAISTTTLAEAPPGAPQSFSGGPVQTTWQVVPEPSAAGLVLLGAAAAIYRRRRALR